MDSTNDLFMKLLRQTAILRYDVHKVDEIYDLFQDDELDEVDVNYELRDIDKLFWLILEGKADILEITSTDPVETKRTPIANYYARIQAGFDSAPALHDEFLERLGWIEQRADDLLQKEYDSPYDTQFALASYIHIGAARALALHRKMGVYSEDVSDLYRRVWSAAKKLQHEVLDLHFTYQTELNASTSLVVAFVAIELSTIQRLSGEWERAVELLGECSRAVERVDWWFKQSTKYDEAHLLWCLDNLTLDDLRATLDGAIKLRKADWKSLTHYCDEMITMFDRHFGLARDDKDNPFAWMGPLHEARGIFSARVTPSEAREMLQEAEDAAAKKRLQAYFLRGTSWGDIPERAQTSLVSAERAWFASQGGRTESCLNELQVALEALCYSLFFEQFRKIEKGGEALKDFLTWQSEWQSKGRENPNLNDYSRACKSLFFTSYLDRQIPPLSKGDREFVTYFLPAGFRELFPVRNDGEHDSTKVVSHEVVDRLMTKFLGLGCEGILTRFVVLRTNLLSRTKNERSMARR